MQQREQRAGPFRGMAAALAAAMLLGGGGAAAAETEPVNGSSEVRMVVPVGRAVGINSFPTG